MKIYTQADVDAITRDRNGFKHLPQGNYIGWINFGEKCILPNDCTIGNYCSVGDFSMIGDRCYLGEWCVIGAMCMIGENCAMEGGRVKNARYIKVGPIGSRNDDAYFYADGEGKIFVRAGCFFGTEDEFLSKLMETHGNNAYASGYKLALEFASTVLRERMV